MMMIMIMSDKEKITIQDYQNNYVLLAVHIYRTYCRIKKPLIRFFIHDLYKEFGYSGTSI